MILSHILWTIAPFVLVVFGDITPTNPDQDKKKSAKLPPCSACSSLVQSFQKEMYE